MGLFKTEYEVKPNTLGYLYRNNMYEATLQPGFHKVSDWKNRTELFLLPVTSRLITVTNQEVLTKDNVALRFSFNVLYRITDGLKFLSRFSLDKSVHLILVEAEQRIHNIVQIIIRNQIAALQSEELNERRAEIANFKSEELNNLASEFGVEIEEAQLKDITFPKSVQDLFAKHLEAKIRAKADLENARTTVSTARALKNAAELMKDDENIKFFQLLETITKIASKGKHTFMIGDLNQLSKK